MDCWLEEWVNRMLGGIVWMDERMYGLMDEHTDGLMIR